MTRAEFENLLPDYLAGELDAAGVAAVRAYLADAPEEAARVSEMQTIEFDVRRLAPAQRVADERTVGLRGGVRIGLRSGARTRGPARPLWMLSAVLRYAAAVSLAFGAGYWVRGGAALTRVSADPAVHDAGAPPIVVKVDEPVNPRLAQNFRRAATAYPQGNSLAWAMLSIAK